MAIAVEQDFRGATLDQYDQVLAMMDLAPRGSTVPGGLFHWAAETEDGIRVVDVWETRERFELFAHAQIRPFTRAVGFPGDPEVRIYEIHNYLSARS